MNEFIIIDFKLEVAKEFREWLAEQKDKLLRVTIMSPGGESDALASIIQSMEEYRHKGHKFITSAIGCAQSCGFDLLVAGDFRYAAPGTRLMLHQVWSQSAGTATGLVIGAAEMELINLELAHRLAERSILTAEQIIDKMKSHGGDWFMRPPEALKLGFIDYIGYPDFDIKMVVLK